MYRKILVTTDGSDLAAAAFPHVARLAGDDTEVVLLAVIDTVARVLAQTTLGAAEVAGSVASEVATETVEAQQQEAEAFLARDRAALEALGLARVKAEIAGGVPGEEILRCAHDEDVDIIVMASHGRSGWKRALLGSVADHVARHADGIPVLLVRPPSP